MLDSNPGLDGVLGFDDNTAEAWINAWESTIETHEAFYLSTRCIGATKLFAAGAAMLATVYNM